MKPIGIWDHWTTRLGHGEEMDGTCHMEGAQGFYIVILYMDMKKLPNINTYWAEKKNNLLFENCGFNHEKKIFGIIMAFAYDGSINLYYGQRGLVI